ncbi:MAG: glutamine-hydrolyzing carbamoyl-phosphate synthase small subunit [Acidobacteriota bacterium]
MEAPNHETSDRSPRVPRPGILLLEDGSRYVGRAWTPGTAFGEVVFNTAMTGYQEILTDPSYHRQIVVMTQPHIGNYGVRDDVAESARPWAAGFVARRFTARASNHASRGELDAYLRAHDVPALDGIDTRALVRRLRDRGAMRGVVHAPADADAALPDALDDAALAPLRARLDAWPSMIGQALVDDVTRDAATTLAPTPVDARPFGVAAPAWTAGAAPHVVVYDFGAKVSIARSLADSGAWVTVVPARTSSVALDALARPVDGVLLSNGPGDPAALDDLVANVRDLVAAPRPLFGICLGHQLLALALGARTYKLAFGHHGGNQPVRDVADDTVAITSQNHGFAVDADSLPSGCRVSHVNLNDGTVEGLVLEGRAHPVWSVQYHPEAAPGPHDAHPLFDRFLAVAAARAAAR